MGNGLKALTLDQERALKVMRSGANVFLSGAAGTGKSFLIEAFIKDNIDKNVIICAPTGMAAVNIGGATLHRVFYIPMGILKVGDYNSSPSRALDMADIIIIDEISMCRIDTFEYVIRTLQNIKKRKKLAGDKEHYNKQIILVGDFYQLPPVLKEADKPFFLTEWGLMRGEDLFAFNSTLWDELSLTNIILKTPVRQNDDPAYIENLNKIRLGDASGIEWFNKNIGRTPISDAVFICGKNDVAKSINQEQIGKVEGDFVIYTAEVNGQVNIKEILAEQELKLKTGMKVMTTVNSDEGYQNGSIGYVKKLEPNCIGVYLNNGKTVEVKPFTWQVFNYTVKDDKVEKVEIASFRQFPIKVAYAITIHKAQGQTCSAVNIYPDCFDKGQLYVALSRVKKADQMSINGEIDSKSLRTSQAVMAFYDDIDDELLGWEFDEHKWDQMTIVEKTPLDDKYLPYMQKIKRVKAQAYESWSTAEDQKLQDEWSKGISITEIARTHQRTIGAIRARLRKLQISDA